MREDTETDVVAIRQRERGMEELPRLDKKKRKQKIRRRYRRANKYSANAKQAVKQKT